MNKENIKWDELENKIMDKNVEENEQDESIIEEQNDGEIEIQNDGKKRKAIISIIIISIIVGVFIIFSTIFAIINIKNDNIVNGVKIQGIDVSGLSRDEAKSKIEQIYNDKKQKEIVLEYKEYNQVITPELVEVNYNIEKSVEKALSIGKDSNIITNNYNILFAMMGKKNIDINVTLNEELTNKAIQDIQTNLPEAVIEPSYYIENDNLIITKGKQGIQVEQEKLIAKLKENFIKTNEDQAHIELPVIDKEPSEINIEKIYEEVHKEVKDAYFTKDPFTIHPEVEGIDFNLEEAKKILEEDKEKYEIKLTITKPKVTTSQIGTEAFPNLLATYSTRYDGGDVSRTTNLRIACQKINDKVILPGETFSYNKALGERTAAAGYKNAKVYENGRVVDGIGGGICQISSTLYNSVLKSNLEIVERRNHMFVTSYTPAGTDATVVYGAIDFKFKNTRKNAIKIKASCSNGIATVSIYGIKEETEYNITLDTKTISTIPYTTKYENDSTLVSGKEKVIQNGANGRVTETYIIKSLNGKVVSTKLLSRDTYSAMQKIILKGTKGANTNTNVNNNTGNNNNSNTNTNPDTNTNTNNTPSTGSGDVDSENENTNKPVDNQQSGTVKPEDDTEKSNII